MSANDPNILLPDSISVSNGVGYMEIPAGLRFVVRNGERVLQYSRQGWEQEGPYMKHVTEWVDVPVVDEDAP
jgi:hypothetical protein